MAQDIANRELVNLIDTRQQLAERSPALRRSRADHAFCLQHLDQFGRCYTLVADNLDMAGTHLYTPSPGVSLNAGIALL